MIKSKIFLENKTLREKLSREKQYGKNQILVENLQAERKYLIAWRKSKRSKKSLRKNRMCFASLIRKNRSGKLF